MRKNWKFWLIALAIVAAAVVFVKLVPFGVSLAGIVGFCAGFVSGWIGNVLYNRVKK